MVMINVKFLIFLNFMLKNMEKYTDDILTFAQCSTSNKIGIVGLKTLDYNYILTFNGCVLVIVMNVILHEIINKVKL